MVMNAATSVTAEVDLYFAAVLTADVQTGFAAMAGLNLPTVKLVCSFGLINSYMHGCISGLQRIV